MHPVSPASCMGTWLGCRLGLLSYKHPESQDTHTQQFLLVPSPPSCCSIGAPPAPLSLPQILTLPTILTLVRVAAVPALVAAWYSAAPWAGAACTALFLGASLTDWLDGYLARKLVSRAGRPGVAGRLGGWFWTLAETAAVLLHRWPGRMRDVQAGRAMVTPLLLSPPPASQPKPAPCLPPTTESRLRLWRLPGPCGRQADGGDSHDPAQHAPPAAGPHGRQHLGRAAAHMRCASCRVARSGCHAPARLHSEP